MSNLILAAPAYLKRGYSVKAQETLDRMIALNATQAAAIANFIDTLVAGNNYNSVVEFFLHGGLGNDANHMQGFKSYTAAMVGAPTNPGSQFVFDGIDDALDLNIDLSVVPGISASDISFGATTGSTVPASSASLISTRNSGLTSVEIFNNGSDLQVNCLGDQISVVGGKLIAEKIYHIRKIATGLHGYREGTLIGSDVAVTTTVIPSGKVHIAARNATGVLSFFYAGGIKASWVGAGLQLAPIAFTNAVRQLLTDLGI